MNIKTNKLLLGVAALALLSTILSPRSSFGQGSAFTYQGQFLNSGKLVSGTFNLQFSLWNDISLMILPATEFRLEVCSQQTRKANLDPQPEE